MGSVTWPAATAMRAGHARHSRRAILLPWSRRRQCGDHTCRSPLSRHASWTGVTDLSRNRCFRRNCCRDSSPEAEKRGNQLFQVMVCRIPSGLSGARAVPDGSGQGRASSPGWPFASLGCWLFAICSQLGKKESAGGTHGVQPLPFQARQEPERTRFSRENLQCTPCPHLRRLASSFDL